MTKVTCANLSPGAIYTMTTDTYINALMSGELDGALFKPINHYKRRVVPSYWYEKLFFWVVWFKKEDLVDIEFIGSDKSSMKKELIPIQRVRWKQYDSHH